MMSNDEQHRSMTPETFLNLVRDRRSVRRYSSQPPGRDVIRGVLEAARWAPSNHNRQGWKFLVLDDAGLIRGVADRVEQALTQRVKQLPSIAAAHAAGLIEHALVFAGAPVVILALRKRPASVTMPLLSGVPDPGLVSGEALSVAMAVQNLLLAAQVVGLGTCVMTGPLLVPEAFAGLELPGGFDLTCIVALGYPAECPPAPRRKELDQIVEFRDNPLRSKSS
jgi:nitroreductase